jgi:hypothetical protein
MLCVILGLHVLSPLYGHSSMPVRMTNRHLPGLPLHGLLPSTNNNINKTASHRCDKIRKGVFWQHVGFIYLLLLEMQGPYKENWSQEVKFDATHPGTTSHVLVSNSSILVGGCTSTQSILSAQYVTVPFTCFADAGTSSILGKPAATGGGFSTFEVNAPWKHAAAEAFSFSSTSSTSLLLLLLLRAVIPIGMVC